MQLTLSAKHPESADVISFIFQPEPGFSWQAGQFLTLTVPHKHPDSHGINHYFTIASAPYEGVVQITTRLTGSTFKQALDDLPLGSTVEASGPEGDFLLSDPGKPSIFLAGGIGITPIHSILKQLDHDGRPIKAALLYANRTAEAIFKTELGALTKRHPDFHIHYITSPERLSPQTIKRYLPNFRDKTFYISGPEPMVEALEVSFVNELGLSEAQMIRDYFPGYDQKNF